MPVTAQKLIAASLIDTLNDRRMSPFEPLARSSTYLFSHLPLLSVPHDRPDRPLYRARLFPRTTR